MLACSLYVEFCRRYSRFARELHFFSLLVTTSSCVHRSSFTLPQTVSIFKLESSRILSSLVKRMLIVWVFSWLVLSILSIQHDEKKRYAQGQSSNLSPSSNGHNWFRYF